MLPRNEDEAKGAFTELKGKAMQLWSKLSENDFTELKGNVEELKGKVQKIYGFTKEEVEIEFEKLKQKGASLMNNKVGAVNDSIDRKVDTAEASKNLK